MANTPLSSYDKALADIESQGFSIKPAVAETERRPSSTGNSIPANFVPLFDNASSKYQVPVNILQALAQQESSFNPTATGTQTKWGRAKGMMQYLDSTAAGMGINPYDPAQAIDAAAKQIRERLDKGYSMEDAVMEHFAGPDRKQWGEKTAQYGKEVMQRAQNFLNGSTAGPNATQQAPADQEQTLDQQYPDAQSGMENMDQQRLKLNAMVEQMNAEEPGRYTLPTPEQMAAYQAQQSGQAPAAEQPAELGSANIIDVQAQAKQSDEQLKVMNEGNKNANIFTDTLTLLQSGLNSTAQNAQELVSYIPVVGPSIVAAADRFDRWANGKGSDELFKDAQKAIDSNWSPEMLSARKKDFVTEGKDGYSFGPAWSDPRAYYSGLVESLPETALTMGAAGRLAKGAYTGMLAKGATRAEAARRAATVATAAGGFIEGGMGGAASSRQVREEIMGMTPEQLKGSEVMNELMAQGKTFEQAKATLAHDSAAKAFVLAGIGTGVFGGMGDRALAKIITTPMMGRLKSAAKGAIAEGLLEEAPQSALQQTAENYAMQGADPTRPLSKGVANATAQGAVVGGLMGAGMGGAAPHVSEQPAQISPLGKAMESASPQAVIQTAIQTAEAETPAGATADVSSDSDPVTFNDAGEPVIEIKGGAEDLAKGAKGNWFGEPGTQNTVIADGVPAFTATIEGYSPSGDVQLRDEAGNAYEIGRDELTLPSTPVNESAQSVAETETENTKTEQQQTETTPAQVETLPDNIDPETGEILDAPVVKEVEAPPAKKTLEEMSEPELRERMKYLGTQAKQNGGWGKLLTDERRKVEKAIYALEPAAIEQPTAADNKAVPETTPEISNANPAQNRDGSQKWFGAEERANAYIDKKGIGETHEVKLVGRRFEIHPKAAAVPDVPVTGEKVTGRVEGGPRVNRARKLLNAEVGDVITAPDDIGNSVAGKQYRIKGMAKNGRVDLVNTETGNEVTLTLPDLENAQARKLRFSRVNSPTDNAITAQNDVSIVAENQTASSEQKQALSQVDEQADSMRVMRERANRPKVETSEENASSTTDNVSESANLATSLADVVAEAPTAAYGSENKLVSTERANELRKKLKAKLAQLNAGIDPEILTLGTELAVYHIEAGVRKFSAFAKAMAADLDMPLAKVRPYLRSWYNGSRDMMEDSGINVDGMDSPETVRAELAKLDYAEQSVAAPDYQQRNSERLKNIRSATTKEEVDAILQSEMSDGERDFSGTSAVERAARERLASIRSNTESAARNAAAQNTYEQGGDVFVSGFDSEYGANALAEKLNREDPSSIYTVEQPSRSASQTAYGEVNDNTWKVYKRKKLPSAEDMQAGEEYAADRVMSQDEVNARGDDRESPWLFADGRIVGSNGDHISLSDAFGYDGYRDMSNGTGAIRAQFYKGKGDDQSFVSLQLFDDQKLTPAQYDAIASFANANDAKVMLGIDRSGNNTNNVAKEEVSLSELRRMAKGGQSPAKQKTPARADSRQTRALDDMVSQFDSEVSPDVPSTARSVEPDSQNAKAAKSIVSATNGDVSGRNDAGAESAGNRARAERSAGQRDSSISNDGTPTGRERGDQRVHQPDGQFQFEGSTAGSVERTGGRSDSEARPPVERSRARDIRKNAHASGADNLNQRLAKQKKADKAPTVWGDRASIDAAVPLLLEPQRDDVLKIEQQFEKMPGMLVTNGTGTGKTASGMGVAKRFMNDGKTDILIVVPSDKIASDWVKFASMVNVPVKQLEGITDNGKSGPVITTYANMAANQSLAQRDWDLVITDESHYLSSNEKGESTGALDQLRALTGHHDGFDAWMKAKYAKEWDAVEKASIDAAKGNKADSDKAAQMLADWRAKAKPLREQWESKWKKQEELPKVLFLSATPFAYVKNTDYAEGYLFHHTPPADRYNKNDRGGYNSADAREKFYMEHFGYRMRYNKLTQPEAGVNSELMEQNFNQWLKDTGALIGRTLDVPFDYDRKFALVNDAAGRKLDEALRFLNEHENGAYRKVYDAVMKSFDYQSRMFLLESMKARAAVPMIKQHLALGRKVVVFHDYNKGGGFSPFAEALRNIPVEETETRQLAHELFQKPMFQIDFRGLDSALNTIKAAFPDALFFNGTVSKGQRRRNADAFNDDSSGKNLIVLQSDAGQAGVSLHDTTGKNQRTLINLGMPTKPVAAVQIEGRTYRTGQASDAIFRYLTTGTGWETQAFASKIAERASTAENLALGTDARGLKQSFIDAYSNAEPMTASQEDGKGGKSYDRGLSVGRSISPFDRAKTYYYAQQKNTKRRDQREGTDYFATPEPVGMKMTEWAGIKAGDKVLEPSAGHGAIARFIPDQTEVTLVEPSYDLSQRAALANSSAKIINDTFENLHISNKFDAIVMNPPYGNGGKTAIEHLSKAGQHLREGGRVVALIPRGGMADRRLAEYRESKAAEGLHLVADILMPSSTFERAGTAVNTHVVIFEKHGKPEDAEHINPRTIDLSGAESVGQLFDRIESVDVAPRSELTIDEAINNSLGNRYSVNDVRSSIQSGTLGKQVKQLVDAGRVVIHDTAPQGVPTNTQGWTDKQGVIHLVADQLNADNARSVLMHEAFHAGARPLMGEIRWKNLNDRFEGYLRAAENRTDLKPSNDWERAFARIMIAEGQGDLMNRDRAREEMAAYAVENFERMPAGIRKWAETIIGYIKEFVARRFGKQIGEVSPAQLRSMAAAALRSTQAIASSTVEQFSVTDQVPSDKEVDGWLKSEWDSFSKMSSDKLTKAMPAFLATVPMRPLLNELGKPLVAAQEYMKFKQAMDALRGKWHARTDEVAQNWLKYRAMNKEENRELMDIMHESTRMQIDPTGKFEPLMTPRDSDVLREGLTTTSEHEQAVKKAATDSRRRAAYGGLKASFDALSPEAKTIYVEVRDAYKALADGYEAVLIGNMEKAINIRVKQAEREYNVELKRIRDEGLTGKERQEAIDDAEKAFRVAKTKNAWNRKARITQMRQTFEMHRIVGPYFPLARFGDYFVTVRDADSGEIKSFSRFEDPTAQRRFMNLMKRDKTNTLEHGVLRDAAATRKQIDPGFVADVEDILSGVPGADGVKDQVWQRYLETLPDMSVRKNRIHRKGRDGFDSDALRAFGSHMFHGSHQLARLKYAMDMGEAIDAAFDEATKSADPVRNTLIVKELEKRNEFVMNPTGEWWAQAVTSAAFVYHLGVSPAAAMVNTSQTVVIGVPIMAAYQGSVRQGFKIASAELVRATKDFTRGKGSVEKSKGLNADEKSAMAEGYQTGVIDRTQSHDLAGVGESGVEYSPIRTKVMGAIGWAFHHTERFNREVTFLASYRMARMKGENHSQAVNTAADLTWKIHFDYQNTSRPRVMYSDTAKALLVFRNYNVNMLYRLFRDIHQAINANSKAERKEAIMQLAGITGMMMLHAGIKGTWLFGIAMVLAGMFMDKDEDPEQALKAGMVKTLGPTMAGLALNGVPGHLAGIAISERIGMPDLWFRSPTREMEGDDSYNYWVNQMLGAAPSIVQNAIRGTRMVTEGNVYRGIETMMPKWLKDPMRAWRYATEGAETLKGDALVDKFSNMEILVSALGFTPAALAERYDINNANMNKQKIILAERTSLMDRYYKADRDDNQEKVDKVLEEIDKFSDKYPEQAITQKNLNQSLKTRERNRENNIGGMNYNRKLEERIIDEQAPTIYGRQ